MGSEMCIRDRLIYKLRGQEGSERGPCAPPPELLFRRDSAPLLARLWELWEHFRRTVSSPDGPYRRHAEYHLAATASANPFLVRRDLPLLPSPSPTTAPGAWMTEARRATSVAWGERFASPSFCRSASFHRADTPRDEGGTRQADLYLMLHAGRLAAGPDAHALRGSRRTARSRRGRGVPPKSAAAQCAADLHVAATRACVYAYVRCPGSIRRV